MAPGKAAPSPYSPPTPHHTPDSPSPTRATLQRPTREVQKPPDHHKSSSSDPLLFASTSIHRGRRLSLLLCSALPRRRVSAPGALRLLLTSLIVSAGAALMYSLATLPAPTTQYKKFLPRHNFIKAAPAVYSQKLWDPGSYVELSAPATLCPHELLLHIIITSSPEHQDRREAIRQTWCQATPDLRCSFLIGRSHLDKLVATEAAEFGDIVIGSYMDTYRNLTLKVTSGLAWALASCPSHFLLKTDDDIFVNSPVLLTLLRMGIPGGPADFTYTGHCMHDLEHTQVIRRADSKWAVSEEEYAPDYYPAYISGTGYLLSRHAVAAILDAAPRFRPFPVEDAYIGVLAEQAGVTPEHTYRFTLIADKWSVCNFLYLLLLHLRAAELPSRQRRLWATVGTAREQCKEHRLITQW